MPGEESSREAPLTFGRFVDFYQQHIEPRFEKLDKLEKEFTEFRQEVNTRFDDLYKKFEDLHTEYLVISHQLKRIEQKLDGIERQTIPLLKEQITNLQKRVEALEANPHQ